MSKRSPFRRNPDPSLWDQREPAIRSPKDDPQLAKEQLLAMSTPTTARPGIVRRHLILSTGLSFGAGVLLGGVAPLRTALLRTAVVSASTALQVLPVLMTRRPRR